ncbi:hypothetical protein BN946_scf184660.g4 [Trametes cinnabarina]|uniref:HAT C-terminal dimerisation domain-containing protein n=1 Tax=Pycnoporus cinnabarinus TaxID=5643 RepID=A0A060SUS1_PYCCI|nr:hypothetical protein BN946_scf184660.g4 [Trametes cinnabarina]
MNSCHCAQLPTWYYTFPAQQGIPPPPPIPAAATFTLPFHTGSPGVPQAPAVTLQDVTAAVVNQSSPFAVSSSAPQPGSTAAQHSGKRPAIEQGVSGRKRSKRHPADWTGTPTTASVVGVGPTPQELTGATSHATAVSPPQRSTQDELGESTGLPFRPGQVTDSGSGSQDAAQTASQSQQPRFIPPSGLLPSAAETSVKQQCNHSSAALDVWYFCRPLETREEPSVRPKPEEEPVLTQKPKTPFVGCKLCVSWKTYKNSADGGVTNTIRAHLKSKHSETYEAVCKIFTGEWKHVSTATEETASRRPCPREDKFTPEGLLYYLARWIAADDQSINVVEREEFQDLIFYLRPDLDEKDYPHRTKLTEAILGQWAETKKAVFAELRSSTGRVHYTCDIWSDQELASYLAITAHHVRQDMKGNILSSCNHLIAFRRVWSHAGASVADVIINILRDAGLLSKIGMFTLDNASSNDTLMAELERLLGRAGIPFDRNGNRIRCFPHVINIAVQHILQEIKTNPLAPLLDLSDAEVPHARREEVTEALEADPVGKVRSLVSFCRQSDQRRVDFRRTIEEGKKDGLWRNAAGETITLPVLQLLRDCETRWSSTFLMIQRVFLLYQAIEKFLQHASRADISHVALKTGELDTLKDIFQILEGAHQAQQLVSSERTPCLSIALPAYELVLVAWHQLRDELPHMRPYLDKGIEKIQEYVYKSRKSRIHALAIVLNPAFKTSWIRDHWTPEALAQAEEWVLDAMQEYRTKERLEIQPLNVAHQASGNTSIATGSSSTFEAQNSGLSRLLSRTQKLLPARNRTVRPYSSDSSIIGAHSVPSESAGTSASIHPTQCMQDTEAHLRAQDRATVKSEFDRYIADGLTSDIETGDDLLVFWARNRKVYPYMHRVAIDILTAQASAVACERVFSSSKETDTLRRSRIASELMEALQGLKYHVKQSRLNLSAHLVAKEEDYLIEGPVTLAAMKELLAHNKLQELEDLLRNSRTPYPSMN